MWFAIKALGLGALRVFRNQIAIATGSWFPTKPGGRYGGRRAGVQPQCRVWPGINILNGIRMFKGLKAVGKLCLPYLSLLLLCLNIFTRGTMGLPVRANVLMGLF